MPTLSPRASFWTAAVVAGLALWASAAPTVAYPVYAREWHLTPQVTTAIFAVYPVALIPVLLVFGNLSDVIGRRKTILIGVTTLAAGSLAFGLAPDLTWVLIGRVLMGVGVGFSLSPATAAMVEFGGPARASRASSTTTAATASGLALATLVGGALVQYAPQPLHLTFWVLFVVTMATLVLVWFLPRHNAAEEAGRWRPRTVRLPRGLRSVFAAGTLGVAAAYSSGAIFLALGAQIARDLVHSTNAFLDGAVISVSAIVIGVVALVARRLAPRLAVSFGTAAAAVGLTTLIAAGATQSLVLFLVAAVISGGGYSLLFAGGLGLIAQSSPVHHRAAILSAAYAIAYLAQAATALGLGAVATAAGLERALEIGSPVIIAMGVAALLLAQPRPVASTLLQTLETERVPS